MEEGDGGERWGDGRGLGEEEELEEVREGA